MRLCRGGGVGVAGFGVGHGVAGELAEGFGAAAADRVVDDRQVRIFLTGERVDRGGDLSAGFGVEPPIEPVHAVEGAGDVQLLIGVVLGRPLFGVLGRGRRPHDGGEVGQLAGGDVRRRVGQRLFDLGGQISFQGGNSFADDRRMAQADVAGLPGGGGGGHPVDECPAELEAFGCPAVRLTGHVPQIGDGGRRPIARELAGAIDPLDQPAGARAHPDAPRPGFRAGPRRRGLRRVRW